MIGLRDFRVVVASAILGALMGTLLPDMTPMGVKASEGDGTRLGSLMILTPWARASAGAGKAGAAYLTIVNHGTAADRLVAVRSKHARRAELHTHEMAGGVMKMRPVEAIVIAAGERVELKPGGDHVMLMGLHESLEEGGEVVLELVFETAGSVTVTGPVGGIAAKSAPMEHRHGMPGSGTEAHEHSGEQAPTMAHLPAETSKMSDHHHFLVSLESEMSPLQINAMHSWVLTILNPQGVPVEDAETVVDGGMAAHGHGLPTAPRVTRYLGGGRYLVEGVKFNMSGAWQFVFTIAAGSLEDRVTFDLMVH